MEFLVIGAAQGSVRRELHHREVCARKLLHNCENIFVLEESGLCERRGERKGDVEALTAAILHLALPFEVAFQ